MFFIRAAVWKLVEKVRLNPFGSGMFFILSLEEKSTVSEWS